LGATGEATGATLLTSTARICQACGAAHFDDAVAVCHHCRADLAEARRIRDLFRVEQLGTQPTERITANDEERQRQGFEILTSFELNEASGGLTQRDVYGGEGALLAHVVYSGSATLFRVNLGLRRRRQGAGNGFKVDPQTGYWKKLSQDDEDVSEEGGGTSTTIVPYVEDRKNALLWRFSSPEDDPLSSKAIITLQHALKRGIEAVCQVEESELQAEPLPNSKDRTGVLFYESSEGGAGVLNRVAIDPALLRSIASEALRVMHFDLPDGTPLPSQPEELHDVPETQCVAGCYRCLLSYYNQPDHPQIDRQDAQAKRYLMALARCELVTPAYPPTSSGTEATDRMAISSGPLAMVLDVCAQNGWPMPTKTSLAGADGLVWNAYAAAFVAAPAGKDVALAADRLGLELHAVEADTPATTIKTLLESLLRPT